MKLCWWCEHFCYQNEEDGRDLTEDTPPLSFSVFCGKNHWTFTPMVTTEEEFRRNMQFAEFCPDYNQTKEVEDLQRK